ncbi:MAG: lysylphosphatidylglycerol synthase transmembrane domain-containing protein [Acidobacteria bacterium]|nr:lysylphosphatidylglycerol synthase transmembrane domain-containing protein [Acidobacteriota bacterium]
MAILVAVCGLGTFFLLRHLAEAGFSWSRFVAIFGSLHPGWLLASAFFAILTYLGRAVRWAVMIRPLRPKPDLWKLFCATAIGFTAVVIFGRAGEPVRPYLIAAAEDLPFPSQVAAWILERIYDLLVVLLIIGIAMAEVHRTGAHLGPTLAIAVKAGGYLVALGGILCLLILFLFARHGDRMRARLLDSLMFLPPAIHDRVSKIVHAFVQGMEANKSPSAVLLLIFYTAVEWAIIIGCYICLFRAIPATSGFSFMASLIFLGFVAIGSVFQLPGIGGGVQIASVVILTELFGLKLEDATVVALMIWIITFVIIVPLGLLLAFHQGLNWKKFKELEEKAAL